MCNIENVKYSIKLMKNAINFDILRWQSQCAYENISPAQTIEDIHSCGTSACFAGYVAASEKFKLDGGIVGSNGAPFIEGNFGEFAIAKWLNISIFDANDICGLGDRTKCGEDIFYGKQLEDITPEDVIEKLEELLAGYE